MAQLTHKGCKGVITVDLTELFVIRTHSLVLSPENIKTGVLELDYAKSGSVHSLVCNRCEKKIAIDDPAAMKSVLGYCLTCSSSKPITTLFTSYYFPSICEKCIDSITEEDESAVATELAKYYRMPKMDIKSSFVPLITVLKKPVK